MAIVRKSLLGLAAACLLHSGLSAQDDDPKALFNDAFRALMTGDKDTALTKLQGVLKLDPTHEAAFKLWMATDKDKWTEMLLQRGDIGKIAKHLLSRAQKGRTELSRDGDAIAALVEKAMSKDFGPRAEAINEISAKHGEFAVPALIAKLADHDNPDGQVYALMAIQRIGRAATLPLIEAAASSNATLRRNIAAAFNMSKDHRSIPCLAGLLKDGNEGVVTVARTALEGMGADTTDSVALYLRQSRNYLVGIGTQGTDISDVVWSFQDEKLAAKDVHASVYPFELAKQSAEKALSMDPSSAEATTLIARAYLGQVAAIDAGNIEDLKDVRANLLMVAMTTGPKVLGTALSESIKAKQPFVAVAAIEALGRTEDKDSLGNSPLVGALESDNSMVRYAAALALTRASRASNVPAAGKVVEVLAQAVAEKNVSRVASVGFANPTQVKAVGSDRIGVVFEANFDTVDQVTEALITSTINPDVLVVNSQLPDGIPADVMGIIKRWDRLSHIKVIVAAEDTDKAEELYGPRGAKIVPASFKGTDLRASVESSLKDVDAAPRKVRAQQFAIGASNALHTLAANRVDVSSAIESLRGQLTREDKVAIPAAEALGEADTSIVPSAGRSRYSSRRRWCWAVRCGVPATHARRCG